MTDEQIIDDLLRREGNTYTDHPADKGGPTKFGITLKTLAAYRKVEVTPEDVQNLAEAEARAIYQNDFITAPGFQSIPDDRLRAFLVDAGVNHGPGNAVKMLQRALQVLDDGAFGPATRGALQTIETGGGTGRLYYRVVAERAKFYGKIITRDPELKKAKNAGIRLQAENAEGWLKRLAEFL